MNVTDRPPQERVYYCPGQKHAISRAVHLGRLAAFYPACRRCPHRDDTGTLSARQIEQLAETQQRARPQSLFGDEGVSGVHLSDLTPAVARDMAIAFGSAMLQEAKETCERAFCRVGQADCIDDGTSVTAVRHGDQQGASCESVGLGSPTRESRDLGPPYGEKCGLIPNPSILLASDGRPITAELTAAVGEGVRFSGCGVIDIGPATAASLAFAIGSLQEPENDASASGRASGGVLVGNPGRQPHVVGIQFWAAGPRPLSRGGSLEPIVQRYEADISREVRNYGPLRRAQVDAPYLAVLAEHYHALRPLRVVVDSASRPLMQYLQKLADAVECQIIPSPVAPRELPEQVCGNAAHFAVCIDGDGETCHVLDEQGRTVPTERLLLLLARQVLPSPTSMKPRPAVVLEALTSQVTVRGIEKLGGRPVLIDSVRRADVAAAIRETDALLAGGPSGRFWHRAAGVALPDALMTVTRLLVLLSRGDEPFSVVLDREVPRR